jgi:hypothetical protein
MLATLLGLLAKLVSGTQSQSLYLLLGRLSSRSRVMR